MNVEKLQHILVQLEEIYEASGASGPAKDIQTVLKFLDGHGSQSLKDFVSETKSALKAVSASQGKLRNASAVNTDVVSEHANRLLAAEIDKDQFNSALQLLNNDARVKKAEWDAIANCYRNAPTQDSYKFTYKTIKKARDAILEAFMNRYNFAIKQKIIDKAWGA